MLSKALAILVCAALAAAAPAPIGMVTANGHFTVDRSEVWGNATLFDGANIATLAASSEAVLRNGVKIQLGAASNAIVGDHRLTLSKGVGQIAAPETYEVSAGGLSIHSAEGFSRMRVTWIPDGRIEVAALEGRARVASEAGLVLALLPPGKNLLFVPQAAQSGSVNRTGCLLYKNGRFLMQDESTQEVIELIGNNFAPNLGNRVNVSGTASSVRPGLAGATSVLNVSTVTLQAPGGCLSVAASLDAQTSIGGAAPPPPQPAGTPAPKPPVARSGGGMSTGAKIAIVGAVAGGGAGAAIALSGKKSSTSP